MRSGRWSIAQILIVMAISVAFVPSQLSAARDGDERSHVLVIGKVSDNPKKHYGYLKPMVDYAVSMMGDLGITRGEVLMAPSNEVMIEYLKAGRVDWVTEAPFSALIFRDEAEAVLLLRKWKRGVPKYRTVFFVRKDSGIATLADLRGRTMAFEDDGSSSAFFVPASVLLGTGLKLVPLASPRDVPPDDAVGYVYSHEEINSSVWVYRGIVDAAAFNDLDWNKEDHMPAFCRDDMQIIYQTEPMTRAIEVVRGDLDPAVRERLRSVLLLAHEDPSAVDALWAYQKTARFDEIDAGVIADLRTMESMLSEVCEEFGE